MLATKRPLKWRRHMHGLNGSERHSLKLASSRARIAGLGALAVTAAIAFGLLTSQPAAADGFKLDGTPKIAMVFTGLHRDGGWDQVFDDARVKLEKAMKTNIVYVENVKEETGQ